MQLKPGRSIDGRWIEFDELAARDAEERTRAFLADHLAKSLAVPPTDKPLSVLIHDLAWREVPEAYPRRGRRWHEAALLRAIAAAKLLITPSRSRMRPRPVPTMARRSFAGAAYPRATLMASAAA